MCEFLHGGALTADRLEAKRASDRRYYERNRKARLAAQALYRAGKCAETAARKRRWRRANPEQASAEHRRYRTNQPHMITARAARRRAAVRQLTPQLNTVERAEVRAIYKTARDWSALTGEPFHVDHIKPLAKGGLHHPSNLQVLPAAENIRKGASYQETAQ